MAQIKNWFLSWFHIVTLVRTMPEIYSSQNYKVVSLFNPYNFFSPFHFILLQNIEDIVSLLQCSTSPPPLHSPTTNPYPMLKLANLEDTPPWSRTVIVKAINLQNTFLFSIASVLDQCLDHFFFKFEHEWTSMASNYCTSEICV